MKLKQIKTCMNLSCYHYCFLTKIAGIEFIYKEPFGKAKYKKTGETFDSISEEQRAFSMCPRAGTKDDWKYRFKEFGSQEYYDTQGLVGEIKTYKTGQKIIIGNKKHHSKKDWYAYFVKDEGIYAACDIKEDDIIETFKEKYNKLKRS